MAEIKVTITDETGNTTSTNVESKAANPSSTDNNKKADVKTKEAADSKNNSQALAIASMVGSRALSYTTSNVGKWTGNSQNQTMVNNGMQIYSLAAMAYVNPYVALATVAINLGTTAIDNAFDNYNQEARRKASLAKAGYNDIGEVVGRRH